MNVPKHFFMVFKKTTYFDRIKTDQRQYGTKWGKTSITLHL